MVPAITEITTNLIEEKKPHGGETGTCEAAGERSGDRDWKTHHERSVLDTPALARINAVRRFVVDVIQNHHCRVPEVKYENRIKVL